MPSETIINAVIGLCEAFGRQASDATVRAYELGLAGLTDEQIQQGCALALQRCRFMPVPVEIRELAKGEGTGFESMAERAFHALTKAVQRHGPDHSVNFTDGAINATVRLLGGWIRVCELPCEEFDKWFRKDFIATYVRVCRDGASEELRCYHGGYLERDNAVWPGRALPGGGTYALGMYGSGVASIGSEYAPALPSLAPKQLLPVARDEFGLELKLLPNPENCDA